MGSKDAMWKLNTVGDTINHDMLHLSADIYYDAPVGSKGQAISAYASVTKYDFGDNYTRNLGVMNPANGNNNAAIFKWLEMHFQCMEQGTTLYGQIGYKI